MTPAVKARTRWTLLRTGGAYVAVIAVTPYLIIKIFWAFGLFTPDDKMDEPGWRAINATTAVLALIGILLAMAFSRPWGERLPTWLVALPVWVGTGLLVPMILLAPVLGPAAINRDKTAGATETWAYEQVFVIISLVGVGVGLPLALAGYARARWPEALSGPISSVECPGHTRPLKVPLALLVTVGCLLLGLTKVFWASGGTLGIDPARFDDRDLWWRMLSLSTAGWAIAGSWGILALTYQRWSRRFFPPMAAAWVSSGMLFAYNLFFAMRTDSQDSPEYPLARVLTTEAGVVLGVMMGMTILLVLHDRKRSVSAEARQ